VRLGHGSHHIVGSRLGQPFRAGRRGVGVLSRTPQTGRELPGLLGAVIL
jgi:hypothetical protein